jgi:hypothetical protein
MGAIKKSDANNRFFDTSLKFACVRSCLGWILHMQRLLLFIYYHIGAEIWPRSANHFQRACEEKFIFTTASSANNVFFMTRIVKCHTLALG